MTAQAAFRQAGYNAPRNAPRLRNNEQVAKRIEELQVRNERKAEMAALSRDELIGILTEIVHATRARLSEARPGDGLKAAEMLAKMCGWNEPGRVNVQSVGVLLPNRRIIIVQVTHDKRIDRNKRIIFCLMVSSFSEI
jgi:hypothetical protein